MISDPMRVEFTDLAVPALYLRIWNRGKRCLRHTMLSVTNGKSIEPYRAPASSCRKAGPGLWGHSIHNNGMQ